MALHSPVFWSLCPRLDAFEVMRPTFLASKRSLYCRKPYETSGASPLRGDRRISAKLSKSQRIISDDLVHIPSEYGQRLWSSLHARSLSNPQKLYHSTGRHFLKNTSQSIWRYVSALATCSAQVKLVTFRIFENRQNLFLENRFCRRVWVQRTKSLATQSPDKPCITLPFFSLLLLASTRLENLLEV